MKRLTLVRHARADWKTAKLSDFERPLDRRGIAEIANMSERLLSQELIPDVIWTSPAVRAVQTAESIARTLGIAMRRLHREDRLYLAPPAEIFAVVHALGPHVVHAMIVAHNPGLTEFARLLAPHSMVGELDTASVTTMVFDVAAWGRVQAGDAHQVVSDSPKRFFQLWA